MSPFFCKELLASSRFLIFLFKSATWVQFYWDHTIYSIFKFLNLYSSFQQHFIYFFSRFFWSLTTMNYFCVTITDFCCASSWPDWLGTGVKVRLEIIGENRELEDDDWRTFTRSRSSTTSFSNLSLSEYKTMIDSSPCWIWDITPKFYSPPLLSVSNLLLVVDVSVKIQWNLALIWVSQIPIFQKSSRISL